MPVDLLAVSRGQPQHKEEHDQAEETDGAVGARVVGGFWWCERAHQDHRDSQQRGAGDSELLGDETNEGPGCIVPYKGHWPRDDGNGHIEEEKPQRNGKIQEEWN